MKIMLLNGSPKGMESVTMQYVRYIQQELPMHEWKIVNIAVMTGAYEKDAAKLTELCDEIAACDGVVWAFPLYHLLVHSQYKRFIELVEERNLTTRFKDKPSASLSTSIHFFDNLAHQYIRAISEDWGMRYFEPFSAEMNDLMKKENREMLIRFAERWIRAIGNGVVAEKLSMPRQTARLDYRPAERKPELPLKGKKVFILTDYRNARPNLKAMVERFVANFTDAIETADLADIDMKGWCLGCIHCGFDNVCHYEDSEGFSRFFREKLMTADAVIFAGEIRDRYLSARFKQFFDRSFFNTHQPYFAGKQMGWIVSGSLSNQPNLVEIFKAYPEFMRGNLAGIVSDEAENGSEIDSRIDSLARNLSDDLETRYIAPATFIGVGGKKVFRDEIYLNLRLIFQADHKYYRKTGYYDYPQKKWGTRILNFLLWPVLHIPPVRKVFPKMIKSGMLQPFEAMFKAGKEK